MFNENKKQSLDKFSSLDRPERRFVLKPGNAQPMNHGTNAGVLLL